MDSPNPITPLDRIISPFQDFFNRQSAGSLLLLLCTVTALGWANSPWADSYDNVFKTAFSISLGNMAVSKDLLHWINDGLMAVFFLAVGLEIKRELLAGELTEWRQAFLPIFAALGGIIVPACIFLLLNPQPPEIAGWGIPVATDIAFSLGVLALLGTRVPVGIKVFLTALAIVDDLGAVIIIALFYSQSFSWPLLYLAGLLFLVLMVLNYSGNRNLMLYSILGIAMWMAFLGSGIHATIAGVLLAFAVPARGRIDSAEFIAKTRTTLDALEDSYVGGYECLNSKTLKQALYRTKELRLSLQPPLQRLEYAIHPLVTFFIIPLFALANAGIAINANSLTALFEPLGLGIVLGLIIGKPVGISLFSWLVVRFRLSSLPANVSWLHMWGVACLAGIGFTMSIFIASLAFSSDTYLYTAKVSILLASIISAGLGIILLRLASARQTQSQSTFI